MRTLTKIIAPALAVALGMGAALPASAHETRHEQSARHTPDRHEMDRARSIRSDIHGLRAQIDRAAARHRISYREANGLHRDARQIQRLYASYARDGLTHRETRVLKAKISKVQFALHMERSDRDGRRG
ncbi:hypothetical protein [Novosphingobium album (ex Hu et al. 2023)]|uniref:Uncharacterized protein n=1 Tax=Novosphingobium album (ex Hu et al. 2023) TaxID=2930093 RepID=A0ABT0AZB7_9SPHN|nr:hypothetical protein [Novosphingobium album (ex Hu et al. 2023)]MCJ2178135.1 hypothetical protein [Novosphingobium album (ex Hu et al. 2023)]